ncbi:MAG: xanthine dehydrogenase family protein subunit M [Actinomycetota bacterium]|nr:xanthine dehydrogenase family protein subunit M [Actinomycetota bacterium]
MQVPARFEYEVATSVDEAISMLQRHGPEAHVLAGGHSLVPMMKLRLASPEVVIDIHKLDGELRYIRDDGGVLKIGALVRHQDLLESELIKEHYAVLSDAEALIADPLVRNMGTVGGSLANGDPGEDLPAAFVALGCEVVVRGPDGERTIPIDDLYAGFYETILEPGEIVTEARISWAPDASSYTKVKRRTGDYAAAAIGVALNMNGEEIEDVRVGMCGVGSTTLRARGAEDLLRGQRPDAELYKRAGERAAEESEPLDDARGTVPFKRDLVKVLLGRALAKAVERAEGGA